MSKFNIAAINLCTETEGPFKRLTIWFQGCNIHCPGCCNPDYQSLLPCHVMSLDELVTIIQKSQLENGIEGVTYTGGEPTLQASLPELTARIHELGLGVISFTGRTYEDVKDALTGCDLVLDGPYQEKKPESQRRIIGSENKRILCLTDRYKNSLSWFFDSHAVEVNVADNIFANGDHF